MQESITAIQKFNKQIPLIWATTPKRKQAVQKVAVYQCKEPVDT